MTGEGSCLVRETRWFAALRWLRCLLLTGVVRCAYRPSGAALRRLREERFQVGVGAGFLFKPGFHFACPIQAFASSAQVAEQAVVTGQIVMQGGAGGAVSRLG